MKLIEDKGEDLLNEIRETFNTGLKRESPAGDSNV
jgi:hypothetical protein